jgi:hypothetical protein
MVREAIVPTSPWEKPQSTLRRPCRKAGRRAKGRSTKSTSVGRCVGYCSVSPGTKNPMLAPGSPAICKSRAGQSEDMDIVTKDAESSWSVDSRVEAEKLVRRARVVWMQAGQAWLSCPGQRREASQQGGSSRGSWILAQWRCEGGGLPGCPDGPSSGPSQSVMAQLEKCNNLTHVRTIQFISFSFPPHPCRGMTGQMENFNIGKIDKLLRTRQACTGFHLRLSIKGWRHRLHRTQHPTAGLPGTLGLLGSVSCLCGSRC